MSLSNVQAITNTNSSRVHDATAPRVAAVCDANLKWVCITKNNAGDYVLINAAAKGCPVAVFDGLGEAMAAAYRID